MTLVFLGVGRFRSYLIYVLVNFDTRVFFYMIYVEDDVRTPRTYNYHESMFGVHVYCERCACNRDIRVLCVVSCVWMRICEQSITYINDCEIMVDCHV